MGWRFRQGPDDPATIQLFDPNRGRGDGLAGPPANAYPRPMCRHITKEQQIEGWRALIELLPKLKPGVLGGLAGALMARLRRGIDAAVGHRA